jgi:hypothetical protein
LVRCTLAATGAAALGAIVDASAGFPHGYQRTREGCEASPRCGNGGLLLRRIFLACHAPTLCSVHPGNLRTRRPSYGGDSHAEHMGPLLEPFAKRNGASVLIYRACFAVIDNVDIKYYQPALPNASRECGARAIAFLQHHPEINSIILAAAWGFLPLYADDPEKRSEAIGSKLFEAGLDRRRPRAGSSLSAQCSWRGSGRPARRDRCRSLQ